MLGKVTSRLASMNLFPGSAAQSSATSDVSGYYKLSESLWRSVHLLVFSFLPTHDQEVSRRSRGRPGWGAGCSDPVLSPWRGSCLEVLEFFLLGTLK